jgi:cytoskeletal protein CcmA (bactofilin family)
MTTERRIHLSGFGQVAGGTYDEVSIEGFGRVTGDVECGTLSVSGKCHVRDNVRAQRVIIEGKCDVHGDIEAHHMTVSGWLSVDGNVSAETLRAHGALRIDGLLSADQVDLSLHGPGRIREIGGGTVTLTGHRRLGLRRLFGVHADTVEGDEVRLTGVTARLVRGGTVEVGPGCRIDRVEYRQDFRCAPGAVVRDVQEA